MRTQFSADLRLARRKAGYTQRDIAVLLGENQSLVSRLESGERQPDLTQIITLSVIYGRSFNAFFEAKLATCKGKLSKRLKRLPTDVWATAETYNRQNSIAKLREKLEDKTNDHAA